MVDADEVSVTHGETRGFIMSNQAQAAALAGHVGIGNVINPVKEKRLWPAPAEAAAAQLQADRLLSCTDFLLHCCIKYRGQVPHAFFGSPTAPTAVPVLVLQVWLVLELCTGGSLKDAVTCGRIGNSTCQDMVSNPVL